ncbi:MAG: prepilin peptidase [Actinomycetota bacterium]
MTAIVAAICGVFGLVIGSFLNVVIWRVPRKESIVAPPSHCPECDTPISPRDNVPVASWVLLRGKCRHCATKISGRYPLVELLTAALFAAVGARFSDDWVLPAYLVFTAGLLALAFIDLDTFLIPNRVLYPVDFISIPLLAGGAAADGDFDHMARGLLGGLGSFGFFFLIHVVSPRGMGFGDVRLSFLLGTFLGYLGPKYVVGGLFAGFLLGAIIGVALMIAGARKRNQHIPFGPFLVAGAMLFVLAGEPFVDWYSDLGPASAESSGSTPA